MSSQLKYAIDGTVHTLSTTSDIMTGATSDKAGTSGLVPAPADGDQGKYLQGSGTWHTIVPSDIGAATSGHNHDSAYAAKSHGNHVPTTETANNAKFLRNDNTWQTVIPANIGAATSSHNHDSAYAAKSHGNHVPTTETANNAKFLRNDNTWQTVTPANIGAAASSHTHSSISLSPGTANQARYVYFADTAASNTTAMLVYDADFKYNPSTNVLYTGSIQLGSGIVLS